MVIYTRVGCNCGVLSLVLFHEKKITNIKANHNHHVPCQPHYSAWFTTLGVVVHAYAASLKSSRPKIGEKTEGDN